MNNRQIFLIVILGLIGFLVWIIVGKGSDSVEAWDSNYYYIIGLPAMCVASAIAGYMEPKNPVIFGLAVIIFQPIALFFQSEMSPFLIVGILFFIVFATFTIGSAFIGAALRKRSKMQ